MRASAGRRRRGCQWQPTICAPPAGGGARLRTLTAVAVPRAPRDAAPPRSPAPGLPLAGSHSGWTSAEPSNSKVRNFSLPSLRLCCVFPSCRSLPVSSRSAYPVGATTAPHVNPGLLRCLSISPPSSFHPSSFEALLRQQIRLRYLLEYSHLFWSRFGSRPNEPQQSDTALAGPRAAPSSRSLPTIRLQITGLLVVKSIDSKYQSLRRGKPLCTLVFPSTTSCEA